MNDKKIDFYYITTNLGKSNDWEKIPYINEPLKNALNEIGYSGKTNVNEKEYTSFESLLNDTIDRAIYGIKQTKYDNGDYTEGYTIVVCDLDKVFMPNLDKKSDEIENSQMIEELDYGL